ncbi:MULTISPECIES: hypothetical protein [unclassified Burkholderia]|uniref:hypothetical protein n=1 Tax=unclassified Burkholderia TaxID=2613784 RepID=UPI002AAF7FF3|nr:MULTISPECIES: hypothetical protein [unclassified Burkholderia]
MSEADQIDPNRQMMISGSVTRDLSKMTHDPHHTIAMDMAQQTLNPAFLRLADPVEEASIHVPAAPFLAWLTGESTWAVEFFADLQCMAETVAGERLLTTWLSGDRFWSMLRDGCGNEAIDAITMGVNAWRSLGLDEVYFDFHVRGSSAVTEQVDSAASPVAV